MERDSVNWLPMSELPEGKERIVGLCRHDAATLTEDGGKTLTPYGAHAEGMGHVPDGPHVLEWGGEVDEYDDYGNYYSSPNWWFRAGSDFEEVAYPIGWLPLPEEDVVKVRTLPPPPTPPPPRSPKGREL